MPSVISTKHHTFAYNGRESLLALLADQQDVFLHLLEEAARQGWITGARWQDFDQALSYLVVKHDIPQQPEPG